MAGGSFDLALTLSQSAETDRERLHALCESAEAELSGRLRPGLTPEDCGTAFSLAAAWLALAQLEEAGAVSGVRQFSAGDVSITERSGGEAGRASLLRQQAERLLAPWLTDEGFQFRGVRG